jgi:hypothetical protein
MTIPPVTPAPPTLVTIDEFKRYARIETTAEDALIMALLEEVVGLIESYIGKSVTTAPGEFIDDGENFSFNARGGRSLILPFSQIDPTSIVVVNGAGETLDPSGYTVYLGLRQIRGAFNCGGPYVITCTQGYGTLPDYATVWLPRINSLIKDYALFLYQQRTPGASHEGAAGTSVDYGAMDDDTGLPQRVRAGLRKLRGIIT